jgi:ubiquinone/menaquinone biosynthesis C-methylase UbiE
LASNYDNSAWFYDRLSRVVFGRALIKAQTTFLHLIPANARVLIAGGGTGWIIEELAKIHPSGLHITYVELSKNMLALARKRNVGNNTVIYINAPVEDAGLNQSFDALITPFLLDSLPVPVLHKVISTCYSLLKPGSLWLNTDFQLSGKWWQKPLLNSMYLFFKIIGCVDTVELPEIKKQFVVQGLKPINEQVFFGEFIVSMVYRK